jgi:hypothetical protein
MLNTLTRYLAAPLAAIAMLSGGSPADAAEKLARTPYYNTEYGFQVNVPEGWVSVPPQPGEKVMLMKFQSGAASKGSGFVKSELEILYIRRKTVELEDKHAGGTKSTKYERNDAAFKDYAESHYRACKVKEAKILPAKKHLKNALQYKGKMLGGKIDLLAVAIPTADKTADIVLHYYCTDKELKKMLKRVFLPSFMSFRWNQKAKDIGRKLNERAKAGLADSDNVVDKRLLEMKMQIKDMPGWDAFRTKHYVIVYNGRKSTAMMVAKQIEQLLPNYVRLFPPSEPDILDKIAPIVRITKDLDIYSSYGGPGGSAGYWSSGHEELVFYDSPNGKPTKTLQVMRHEAFHQYIYYSSGSVSPHSWFNEGYGDYFAGCEVTPKGSLIEKPFSWRMGIISNHVRGGTHVALQKITSYSQSDYYADSSLCYAEGWSIVYFLNKGPRSSVRNKFKKEWKTILTRYFDTLKAEWAAPEEDEATEGEEGDKPKAPKPPRGYKRNYRKKFAESRAKAVEAAFPGWTDEQWEEFENVWMLFCKANFK